MIVGITGHQDLGDHATIEWIRAALLEQVMSRRIERGLSSLARGADQLFVEVLRTRQVPFDAVIPCAGYEATFEDAAARSHFSGLLAAAEHVHQLAYPRPSQDAFLGAGKWIVDHCDLLLAVWDGEPAAGPGGTGDVVQLARASAKALVHINPFQRRCTEGG